MITATRIGIVLGLVVSLVILGARAKHREPPRAHLDVVSDEEGALDEVLMHYVPELEPVFAATYRDFLRSLDPETHVVFVVRRGDRAKLERFLEGRPARVVEVDVAMGIWSRDRALVLTPAEAGKTELLIPPRTRSGEGSRPADWNIVPAVTLALPDELEVREIPIAFDGGDFAASSGRLVFDVNLFARNRSRGARTPSEMRDRVKGVFGREVIMLGHEVGDVPRHHMSMYMALLDHDTALVGDPAAGEAIVGSAYAPGEASPETGTPLRADFSPETIARFDRAAADLTAAGLRVVRIPTVPFDDKTYFAYTNGVYETRGGHRVARVPSFDVPALDAAARGVYESLGWSVVPIASREVYPQHGTIGCLVNVLRRSSSKASSP